MTEQEEKDFFRGVSILLGCAVIVGLGTALVTIVYLVVTVPK